MGRFFGWVGPAAYMLVALVSTVVAVLLLFSGTPFPLMVDAGMGIWLNCLGLALALTWVFALVWFVGQAAILTDDEETDERWTAHMLNVGFVGRLLLMPAGVLCTLSFLGSLVVGLAGHGEMLDFALWCAVVGAAIVLPFALFQVCAATRLANRGLMGATSLVWHVVLAFAPTLGFIAMCSLYANGREAVAEAHDQRIARTAAAEAIAATDTESEATVEAEPVAEAATVTETAGTTEPEASAETEPEATQPQQ